ncbi:MAG: hypothetical protein AAF802_12595, partial [Planctomycetota bacterium]
VEPTDGETVAIGVKFFVKLSRKLQVKTELYARLDQDLPWWPIDRRRLDAAVVATEGRISSLKLKIDQKKGTKALAEPQAAQLIAVELKADEKLHDLHRATLERLGELEQLSAAMDQSSLMLEVAVKWPQTDSLADPFLERQVVFRTVSPLPEEDAATVEP